MAKTRRSRASSSRSGAWKWIALLVVLALAATWYVYRAPINGYAAVGTAYSARVACSCRFVGGRSLEDCAKDKVAGAELIMLSADENARSVTASFPFVRSDTASYREGYGCVLDEWPG